MKSSVQTYLIISITEVSLTGPPVLIKPSSIIKLAKKPVVFVAAAILNSASYGLLRNIGIIGMVSAVVLSVSVKSGKKEPLSLDHKMYCIQTTDRASQHQYFSLTSQYRSTILITFSPFLCNPIPEIASSNVNWALL